MAFICAFSSHFNSLFDYFIALCLFRVLLPEFAHMFLDTKKNAVKHPFFSLVCGGICNNVQPSMVNFIICVATPFEYRSLYTAAIPDLSSFTPLVFH